MVLLTFRAEMCKTSVGTCSRVLTDDCSVCDAIQGALDQLKAHDFELQRMIVFDDKNETPPGSEMELNNLGNVTASELAGVGKFVVLIAKSPEEQGASEPQKNAFATLMSEVTITMRPTKSELKRYDWNIYNAIIDQLELQDLGFPKDLVKDQGAGKKLLLNLKDLLNLVLPFDDRGVFSVSRASTSPTNHQPMSPTTNSCIRGARVFRLAPATFRSVSPRRSSTSRQRPSITEQRRLRNGWIPID